MSRGRHRTGLALVGLLLVAVATVLDGWLPDDASDPLAEPFVTRARVGEQISMRTLSLEVGSVSGAKTLDEYGSELRSPGVWLVVEYTTTAKVENTAISEVRLRDGRGRTWSGSAGRAENTCLLAPPGVRNGCVAVFEVPLDAVPSLTLRMSPTDEQRYDQVADVDLGLTREDAERFAGTTGLDVPTTTLGGS